jgi:hypothetical protein
MAPSKKKSSTVSAAPPNETDTSAKQKCGLTSEEKAAVDRDRKRRSERLPAARIKLKSRENAVQFSYDHEDQKLAFTLLSDALATTDSDFVNGILLQLLNAVKRDGKVSEADFNFMLSVIKGIKPRDQLESMLAAQMAVVHEAAMTLARRLGNVETLSQQESAINGVTKLTRTFAALLDALKRYRHGGEQKVTVQHVNVNDGGKAIVANIAAQPERAEIKAQRAAPALTHSPQTPMPIIEEHRQADPVHLEFTREAKVNGRKPPP